MRILSVGDHDWMTGAERLAVRLSLFAIRRKLALAAARADHLVVEFSDRAVARNAAPLRLKGLGAGWANRRFLQCVDELRPDLILLHFADSITNASLAQARRLTPRVLIADINIDPIDTAKNQRRLARRRGVVDALFVTTADPALGRFVDKGTFAAFMPNPVDRAIETGRAFEVAAPQCDLLLPATDAEPREIGEQHLPPAAALKCLHQRLPALRVHSPGVAGEPLAFGASYLNSLVQARFGWSLSRRASLPLYASDRMAHMMGSGLATLIDRRAGFQRFYDADAALFYDGLDDLAARLEPLLADDDAARDLARRGFETTWRLFDSNRVLAYLLDQLFVDGGARDYEWPSERWGRCAIARRASSVAPAFSRPTQSL